MKTCRICGEEKHLSQFDFRKDNNKYRTDCKKCRADHEAAKRYGVTVGEVEALRISQNDCCAICGTHVSDLEHRQHIHNPLVIDHDHATGKVRGLLCSPCNTGIGQLKENIDILLSAIDYINKHRDAS